MIKTPIYIVTVTIIKFCKSDIYPNYSTDNLMYYVGRGKISSIHLSLEEAEAQKENLINYCKQTNLHIFSIIIDEYEDGSIISDGMPFERWIYDCHGELVDILHNKHCKLTSSSVIPQYAKGDIVEILTNSDTLHLGIILENPNDSHEESYSDNIIEDKYFVLGGPYYDDADYYGISQLRRYEGNGNEVIFMRDLMSQYPDLLPHVD